MTMGINLLFLLNVLAIAWPVALLEIIIEKDKGWGAGHPKDSWYGKIVGQDSHFAKALTGILGVPHIFGYAVAMYGITIPAVLIIEYFLVIPNVPFLLAVFAAVCFVEDLSWFVFNWHFDSLQQLLKGPNGAIWWHQKWIKISADRYLPRVYFAGFCAAALLLVIAHYW